MIKIREKNDQEYILSKFEFKVTKKYFVIKKNNYFPSAIFSMHTLIKKIIQKNDQEYILSKFEFKVTKKYFPEYKENIKKFKNS